MTFMNRQIKKKKSTKKDDFKNQIKNADFNIEEFDFDIFILYLIIKFYQMKIQFLISNL
jgi:hypothetical protein